MNESSVIREAVADDAEALRAFFADLAAERLPQVFDLSRVPSVDQEREFIKRIDADATSVLFVAAAGDAIVGMLDFHGYQLSQRAHSGWLGMAVSRGRREADVGTRLLEAAIAWVTDHSYRRVELSVFANNPRALRLYERQGFVIEGRRAEAVRIGEGFVDLIEMARMIQTGETGA